MGTKLDITNRRFGKLIAIKEVGKTNQGIYNWLCKCDCGNETTVRVTGLTAGNTKSCGCGIGESTRKRMTKHGHSANNTETPEYVAWDNMKARCYKKSNIAYKNYGGRGIKVCDRWLKSFENFYSDVGPRPSELYSLDRYPDVNGNYCPENVRWATDEQQARGKRNNRWLEYGGKKMVLVDWANELGINYQDLRFYLKTKLLKEVIEYLEVKKLKPAKEFIGICLDNKKQLWRVMLVVNRQKISGGRFKNKYAAALKYNELALKYHGKYACLNVLTEEQMQLATIKEGRRLSQRNNTGYRGVYEYYGRYVAKIAHNKIRIHVGYYGDAKTAAMAYNEAILKNNMPKEKLNIIL